MTKRKDDTIPLWARKNVQARVMPRKPDVIPLWARGQAEVMAKQVPQEPAARAMHNAKRKILQSRALPPTEEVETVREPAARPVIISPAPHPLASRTPREAELQRQRQYQDYAIQAHEKKRKAREAAEQEALEKEAVAHAARANAEFKV